MSKSLCICLGVTLASFASQSFATEQSFLTSVTRVQPENMGAVDFSFADEHANCTNANSPKRYRIKAGQNGATADAVKNIFAAVMFAASADKQIRVYFDDATSFCYITKVLVFN